MRKIIILAIIIFTGCVSPGVQNSSLDTLYSPSYAKRFSLLKNGDTTILCVRDPWQGATGREKRYAISAPYNKIIATSTSHLAFISALECSNKVVGVSGKDYIFNPAYKDCDDIGYDRCLDYEKVLSLGSDCMFVYEVSGESAPVFGKLESMGVNVVYIADYLEPSPLGRAEWIVVFGAALGKLDIAIDYFRMVEKNYTQQTSSPSGKKIILNSPYRDTWYFPGTDSYPVKLIEDAGGEYIGKKYKGSSSVPVNMETAYRYLKESDLWLHPSIGTRSLEDIKSTDARLREIDIPLFNNDKRSTKLSGTDFYETGVVRPDIILHDLIQIIGHTDDLNPDSLFFYRRLH